MKKTVKTAIAVIALILLSGLPAGAKKKEPPVYDHTGTVVLTIFKTDVSATITVNGETVYAGCNVYDTSISCSDSPGVVELKLADGSKIFRPGWFYDFSISMFVPDPLPFTGDAQFQYRMAHIKPHSYQALKEGDYVCVAYTNFKGNPAEACRPEPIVDPR